VIGTASRQRRDHRRVARTCRCPRDEMRRTIAPRQISMERWTRRWRESLTHTERQWLQVDLISGGIEELSEEMRHRRLIARGGMRRGGRR
jgi:hypothetical protein